MGWSKPKALKKLQRAATKAADWVGDNKGAIIGTAVGIALAPALGVAAGAAALIGAASGYGYDSSQKAADKAEEANKNALEAQQRAAQDQRELIQRTGDEIKKIDDDLLQFAQEEGIKIESILLDTNTKRRDEQLKGLEDAYRARKLGISTAQADLTAQHDKIQASLAPWMESGDWANSEMKTRFDELTRQFTLDDFVVDPGYQNRLKAGQDAIINRGSAIGITGNTAKELTEYSQDYAGQEFDQAYMRFRDYQTGTANYLNTMAERGYRAGAESRGYRSEFADKQNLLTLADVDNETGAAMGRSMINDTYYANEGDIKAGTRQNYLNYRTNIDQNRENRITGLAGANIQVSQNEANAMGNFYTNQANIANQRYQANMNFINGMAQNLLFLRFANIGGTPGAGGTPPVPNAGGATGGSYVPLQQWT